MPAYDGDQVEINPFVVQEIQNVAPRVILRDYGWKCIAEVVGDPDNLCNLNISPPNASSFLKVFPARTGRHDTLIRGQRQLHVVLINNVL